MVAQVGGASGGASWWWQTSVGAQILGCKATLWMHHPVVAQVVAQVGGGAGGGASLAQVGGGASLAQVGLVAQVWRKSRLLFKSNLRQTCAKPTCAKLAPPKPPCDTTNLCHHQLAPPLVPPLGGLLCTPRFVHQRLSATTNLRHHLRHQTCATTMPPGAWCLLNFALHPRRCASTPFRATNLCHRPLMRHCDANLAHRHFYYFRG